MVSQLKVNEIIKQSGSSITIGETGDTVSGPFTNVPSFFAYQSSAQSIGNTTQTTVQYDTVLYDTASCFSTSTYRYTPNVAGKYYFGMTVRFDNVNSSRCIGYIYKNTSIYTLDEMWSDSGSGPDLSPKNYAVIDMNGSSDYVEAKCYHDKGFAVNTNPVNEAINFFGYRLIGA